MAETKDKNLTPEDLDARAYIIKNFKGALSTENGNTLADLEFIKELYDIKFGVEYGTPNSIHYRLFTKALENLGSWTKVVFGIDGLKSEKNKGSFKFPGDLTDIVISSINPKDLLDSVSDIQKRGINRFPKETLANLRIGSMENFYGEDLMYTFLGIVAAAEDKIMCDEIRRIGRYSDKLKYVRDTFLEGMFKDSDDLINCLGFKHLKPIMEDESLESETKNYLMLQTIGVMKYAQVLENLRPLDAYVHHNVSTDEYTAPKGFQTPETMQVLVDTLNGPFMNYVGFMERHKTVLRWGESNDSLFTIESMGQTFETTNAITINGEGIESREAITWLEYMIQAPIIGRKTEGIAVGEKGVIAPNKLIVEKYKSKQSEQTTFAVNPQDSTIYVLIKE